MVLSSWIFSNPRKQAETNQLKAQLLQGPEECERYAEIEKKNTGKKEFDVVLVGADNINDLRKAYPNYFVDSREFLSYVQKIIGKY